MRQVRGHPAAGRGTAHLRPGGAAQEEEGQEGQEGRQGQEGQEEAVRAPTRRADSDARQEEEGAEGQEKAPRSARRLGRTRRGCGPEGGGGSGAPGAKWGTNGAIACWAQAPTARGAGPRPGRSRPRRPARPKHFMTRVRAEQTRVQ